MKRKFKVSPLSELEPMVATLLEDLLSREDCDGWWHIELECQGGILKRLLGRGYQPWVEVALREGGRVFLLNTPKKTSFPAHENWRGEGDGLLSIPVSDMRCLVRRLAEFFIEAAAGANSTARSEYRC